ncbi:hypothetical protein UFOVP723_3 [uncultured Caudovirales phage]|uniref:Uncharacterized protein n=1 Tax=uncultured Caudovirales phage TaxID=2100421 RepID=A0A6J5NM90_9CAUD|nr:hypothetical protein UFOVP723_3 [uncultured Caudovirales phage]
MNTKETQQVMKNNDETYISLFEYLGKGSGGTNVGREVTAEAIKQGIDIKWRTLPKEVQKPEYTQVQLYPISFLDSYFANDTNPEIDRTPLVRRSELLKLQQRLEALESMFQDVIKKLDVPTKLEDDYDLPF